MQCKILECKHNNEDGCPFQDCNLLTDNQEHEPRFESILYNEDYHNLFYIKQHDIYGRPYKKPTLGKLIDCGFAVLCTSDNLNMKFARIYDKRTGVFICYGDELKELDNIRIIMKTLSDVPDVSSLPLDE